MAAPHMYDGIREHFVEHESASDVHIQSEASSLKKNVRTWTKIQVSGQTKNIHKKIYLYVI